MLKNNLQIEQGVMNYMKNYYKKSKEAYERYLQMVEIIRGDDIAENLLDNLITKACNYITVVCKNEHAMKMQAHRLEGDDYRELVQSLDRRRRTAHEALLSALYAFNRYCIKEFDETPVGGIYSFDPDTIRNRVAVADWAAVFILSLFEFRKK